MRHGKSVWNEKDIFTGWVDVPLSKEGVQEALSGGIKIRDIPIDVAFTSALIRAHTTLTLSLLDHSSKKIPIFIHEEEKWRKIYSPETEKETIPVYISPRLNERYYGELQGLNKAKTSEKYGKEQVHIWRRSFDVPPPGGESLEMTAKRTVPYFQEKIVPRLQKGENVFVCAHGNSLRSIQMHLDQLSPEEVVHLEIPTGEPIVYTFDEGSWTKD